jgi:hypothetical protein
LLPVLYETFLANCWDYRQRIVPVRLDSLEGLAEVAQHGILPDVVYLDGDHTYEAVYADVQLIRRLFPAATLVGDDWDWEGVRAAVEQVARESGGRVGVHGTAWRFIERSTD